MNTNRCAKFGLRCFNLLAHMTYISLQQHPQFYSVGWLTAPEAGLTPRLGLVTYRCRRQGLSQ